MCERVPIWENPARPGRQFAKRGDGQWFGRSRMSRYLWSRWEPVALCDPAARVAPGAGRAQPPRRAAPTAHRLAVNRAGAERG